MITKTFFVLLLFFSSKLSLSGKGEDGFDIEKEIKDVRSGLVLTVVICESVNPLVLAVEKIDPRAGEVVVDALLVEVLPIEKKVDKIEEEAVVDVLLDDILLVDR